MIGEILLLIIGIELGILIVLQVGKKEIVSDSLVKLKEKMTPNKTEVIEWTPPLSQEELAERKIREELKEGRIM